MPHCRFVTQGTPCPKDATHYVEASMAAPHHWRPMDTPHQLESLGGVKFTKEVTDAHGKPLKDAQGLPIRVPVEAVPEFCLVHAKQVLKMRMARQALAA